MTWLDSPIRALKVYIERSASYRKSEQLFVGFGNRAKGGPVTKQRISRWLVDAITLAYSSLGLQCPIRVRAHSTRGIASSWAWILRGVHFRHLWGGWLVLAVHICKVLQPGCPCLAGQIPFCLSSNLPASLDHHCSSPSFAWSVHNYMDARYHLRDDTQATDDPQGSPCAWCILLTPLGLIHVSLGFELFRDIAQRDWTGSHTSIDTRCSTSEISKENILGYYRNLSSLRYGNEYCVLGSVMTCTPRLLPFEEIWDAVAGQLII